MSKKEIIKIAEFLHETIKYWSEVNRDFSMRSWSDSDEWERDFMVECVKVFAEGGGSTFRSADMHELWVDLQFKHNKESDNGKYIPNKLWTMLSHWQKKKYRIIRILASELIVKEGPVELN